MPGSGVVSSRRVTVSTTCSPTVRPNRASHAFGIGSLLMMVLMAVPSSMRMA